MKRQRGFALLLVFVMAAAVAIALYNELPRVAFEAQRNKEQMLIERGEQYIRAIQLYVRKSKTYPSTIEQLEGTSGQIRFLRKRYNDPMTGKSEWRIVHIGAGGVYTDSLVHKPTTTKAEEKSVNTFTYEAPITGSTVPTAQTDPGFPQLRPSERAGMPMPGQSQQQANPADPQINAQPPAGVPGFPGLPPGVAGPPGAFPPQGVNPQQGQVQPGYPQPGVNPQQQGQPQPVYPQPGVNPQQPFPPPGGPPNPAGPPGQNQALDLINNMLRQPRAIAQPVAAQPQGMQIGAGSIAGIASTVERSGIKIYNEMEKYNEWEFLYDLTQDRTGLSGGQQQLPGQGRGGQQGQNPQPGPGRGGQQPQMPLSGPR